MGNVLIDFKTLTLFLPLNKGNQSFMVIVGSAINFIIIYCGSKMLHLSSLIKQSHVAKLQFLCVPPSVCTVMGLVVNMRSCERVGGNMFMFMELFFKIGHNALLWLI